MKLAFKKCVKNIQATAYNGACTKSVLFSFSCYLFHSGEADYTHLIGLSPLDLKMFSEAQGCMKRAITFKTCIGMSYIHNGKACTTTSFVLNQITKMNT